MGWLEDGKWVEGCCGCCCVNWVLGVVEDFWVAGLCGCELVLERVVLCCYCVRELVVEIGKWSWSWLQWENGCWLLQVLGSSSV